MAQIVVVCERWLGLGARYVVRVDGHEVGRLGRKAKRVAADVSPGEHSVLVDYMGRTTSTQQVQLGEGDTAIFQLTFGSVAATVVSSARRPLRRKLADPIATRGEVSTMALTRLD